MHDNNRSTTSRFLLSSLSTVVLAVSLSGCLSSGGGGSKSSDPEPTPNPLQVSTQQGDYIGIEQSGMRIYRGIRYGVAERFASPEFPAAHEDAVQLSETFGSDCPQAASPFGQASVNEDCLFLNVYTPEEPGEYPVMVWIHGGAFIYGSGGASYEPQRLVENGVVVVTLNYRLGALGFLPHAALGNANFGLQDQQLALRWVQENIAAFNGDADNVTLFGESAGGHSVLSQVASPDAEGLFHKAIVQSGSYNGEQIPLPFAQAMFGNPTVAATACATVPSETLLDCLREQSVEDILAAQPGNILPATGTETLPVSINQALRTGAFNQVPVMMGSNLEEGSLFTLLALAEDSTALNSEANYRASVAALLSTDTRPLNVDQIATDYLADFPESMGVFRYISAYSAIGTDWRFNCPNSYQWNQLQAQVPTWGYWFTDRTAPPLPSLEPPFPLGATHTAEIQFVLSSEETLLERGATEDNMALAQHMASYWSNFARYGDDPDIGPNGTDGSSSSPEWPQLSTGQIMQLDSPDPSVTGWVNFRTTHSCDYWLAPPQTPGT